MKLFIRLKNGQPFEHPIVESNFVQSFPGVDLNNLPEWVMPFERVSAPLDHGVFEVPESSYQIDGNICKDVWTMRPMTDDERSLRISQQMERVVGRLASFKAYAAEKLTDASDENKQVWQAYVDQLDAVVINDPFVDIPPAPPIVN